jgi:hypothetical protein
MSEAITTKDAKDGAKVRAREQGEHSKTSGQPLKTRSTQGKLGLRRNRRSSQ